jgi:hypothetical protein
MNKLYFLGSIPNIFNNMQNLSRLTISENEKITGPIPKELGNLKKLTSLNLIFLSCCIIRDCFFSPGSSGRVLNEIELVDWF